MEWDEERGARGGKAVLSFEGLVLSWGDFLVVK